ncbi:MAG: TRAP transporter substrate-binding protein [Desulfarculus sp.]|nr:TRAP transporter substrate-binding protein [Desulfarculus sp.]
MRKAVVVLLTSLVLALTLFVLAGAALAQEQEKVIKLKYSNFFPAAHKISQLHEQWCREVEKRSQGRVKITYFPANTLTPPTQTYDSVMKGIADIGMSLLAYSPGRFPLSEVLTLPLGYTSGYQSTKTANAFYKQFQPKEFDNVKVLFLHAHGPGLFHTKKQIHSIAEIKGMRTKVNADVAGIAEALGAVPVTMPITECYDGMQKGLLDALQLPMEGLKGWRFAEVSKTTIENHGMSYAATIFAVMNKDKWNSLPPDVQAAIEEINLEWIEKQGKLWNQLDQEAREFALQKGMNIVTATPQEEAEVAEKMKPLFAKYVKSAQEKGLPGQEALAFCQDYLTKNK